MKNTTIITAVVLVMMFLLRTLFEFSFLYFMIPITVYLIFIFFGAKNICSQFFLKSKCFSENKEKVLLTFDDGPNPQITPKILAILKKHNKKAIFFCIGKNIEKHPEIIKEIIKEGHKIGNHSYSHSNFFDFYGSSKVISEIKKTNELIKNITGNKCNIFRPPFGITNPHIAKAVRKLNIEVVGWSIRSLDTIKNKKTVLKRLKKVKTGDIILFHDTKKQTVEILDEFLQYHNAMKFRE